MFRYTRAALVSFGLIAVGVGLAVPLLVRWASDGFTFSRDVEPLNHLAVGGSAFAVIGFATFTFTLMLHALSLRGWRRVDVDLADGSQR
jgi:hypothetical protein